MLIRQGAVNYRTDRVEDVFARKVKRGRDLRLTGRLLITLLFHNVVAEIAQAQSRSAVNTVVLAVVERSETTEHLRIGGVDDSVAFNRCYVALP